METPARCATWRMLAAVARRRFGFFRGPPISGLILDDFLCYRKDLAQELRSRTEQENIDSNEGTQSKQRDILRYS
jgi:hypothetical protein